MPVYWSRCGRLSARCADLFDGNVIDRAVRTLDDLKPRAGGARGGFKRSKPNVLLFDARAAAVAPDDRPPAIPSSTRDDVLAADHQLAACARGAGKACGSADLNFNTNRKGCAASQSS